MPAGNEVFLPGLYFIPGVAKVGLTACEAGNPIKAMSRSSRQANCSELVDGGFIRLFSSL
jgi:hypothetical protein